MRHERALIIPIAAVLILSGCGQTTSVEVPYADEPDTVIQSVAEEPAQDEVIEAEPDAGQSDIEEGADATDTDAGDTDAGDTETGDGSIEKGDGDMQLKLKIGDKEVSVEWEDNESVRALSELAAGDALTVQMSMYGGFEQVGSLGAILPRDDKQTTTNAGDIVLYSGNQIVVFYGSNSWAYTKLGRITDLSQDELSAILGNGDVTITITNQKEEQE